MATKEQIDRLKIAWVKDSCWDIETTEGFEEHAEELLTFRKQQEADWENERQEKAANKAKKIGISDPDLAECLYTPYEIEKTLRSLNLPHEQADFVNHEIVRTQVRTLLFVGIQLKRIADALETDDLHDALEESVRI